MQGIRIPSSYRPVVRVKRRDDRGGKIQAYYALPPQHNEQRVQVRVTLPFTTMRDAELWAAKKQQELIAGQFDDADYARMGIGRPSEEQGMTLREFLPRFRQLRERGRKRPLSARYVETQERIIELYLLPTFGEIALDKIDVNVIDQFILDLEEGDHPDARSADNRLAPHTINNVIGVLGRILTIAARRGVIQQRPMIEKLPVEVIESSDDILSKDEVGRLFGACRGVTGRMIQTYVLTGCRAMEAAALRWEDYDPVAKRLWIRHQIQPYVKSEKKRTKAPYRLLPPKWNSTRWVPVGPALAAILNAQAALTRLQDGFIFLTEAGKPFCNELIRKALHRTCRRAKLRVVSPQVLRRTFVSQLVMAGRDPKTVQMLAGHKSLSVTMKYYTRLEDSHVQEAARCLEEHLFGSTVAMKETANNSNT